MGGCASISHSYPSVPISFARSVSPLPSPSSSHVPHTRSSDELPTLNHSIRPRPLRLSVSQAPPLSSIDSPVEPTEHAFASLVTAHPNQTQLSRTRSEADDSSLPDRFSSSYIDPLSSVGRLLSYTRSAVQSVPAAFYSSVPETPKGPTKENFKYFCPICFFHYQSIYRSHCCSNYVCAPCLESILHQRLSINLSGILMPNHPLPIACPSCNTENAQFSSVAPDEKPRNYRDSPSVQTHKQSEQRRILFDVAIEKARRNSLQLGKTQEFQAEVEEEFRTSNLSA
jgi:hypothetical protein